MEHREKMCCFDSTDYTGVPDTAPCPQAVDVPGLIRRLDELYATGKETEAEGFLEQWRDKAAAMGDWRGELSLTSELLGQYRRSMNEEKGLAAVNAALEIIKAHGMGRTVSGATVILNAATTLNCFDRAGESLPLFRHVCRVYGDSLDMNDYRFAGLYNNMALSYAATGDIENAERHFALAMNIMEKLPNGENELAVTLCNMAQMYGSIDREDSRIDDCLESAWEYLNTPGLPRDGYHAFTVSKCAPCFDEFGYFMYVRELRERTESIYAGN